MRDYENVHGAIVALSEWLAVENDQDSCLLVPWEEIGLRLPLQHKAARGAGWLKQAGRSDAPHGAGSGGGYPGGGSGATFERSQRSRQMNSNVPAAYRPEMKANVWSAAAGSRAPLMARKV